MIEYKSLNAQMMGCFFLEGTEFAIDVCNIREVVNSSGEFEKNPSFPGYFKGFFNFRGLDVPVIDLNPIFGLSEKNYAEKIVVIEHGSYCFAILFDQTGEVFKLNADEVGSYDSSFSSKIDQLIKGTINKHEGRRKIQILNIAEIVKLESVPFEKNENQSNVQEASKGMRHQCISFTVNSGKYALDIENIQEILIIDKVKVSALAFYGCIGMISVRGVIVPVFDSRILLKLQDSFRREDINFTDKRVIVIRLEKEFIGLLVDQVESIITYFDEDLLKPQESQFQVPENVIAAALRRDAEDEIGLLDYHRIIQNAEIIEISKGHKKIYQIEDKSQDVSRKQNGKKTTLITFTLKNYFAIPIEEIKEIIECPKELIILSESSEQFNASLMLRGDRIVVVDGRRLYSLPVADIAVRKILVFKQASGLFGLIVDSVDTIENVYDSNKMKLPQILYNTLAKPIIEDTTEALKVGSKGHEKGVLVLNPESIYNRASQKMQ